MLQQIINRETLHFIRGKFIVQINKDESTIDITQSKNPDFWLEKRIKFIAFHDVKDCSVDAAENDTFAISMNGLFYSNVFFSIDEFIKYFNGEAIPTKRYWRLLTTKELQWLMNEMIKLNYG